MKDLRMFYINGDWVTPESTREQLVIDPATETAVARIILGDEADVNRAVQAARNAFPAWAASSRDERIAVLGRIMGEYQKRAADLAAAITSEMGAPAWLAQTAQVPVGFGHFLETLRLLKDFPFEETLGGALVQKVPVGVCALITPWNWPINQILTKVLPALATGNTMILKPSEIAPLSAHVLAEIFAAANVPAGVFNLVDGDGPGVGTLLSTHPDIDMVSFTGSTRAGVQVAQAAAATVKRVSQELGGKSAYIVLPDADLESAVRDCVNALMMNSGQTCVAPSRLLVPSAWHADACDIAKAIAEETPVLDPHAPMALREDGKPVRGIGPLANRAQFEKVQALIETGIAEGATLLSGGPGRPDGFEQGYFVKPTVFGNVHNDMTIAREEIFGPVVCILSYEDEADAVRIANDTRYGLAGYVRGGDPEHARAVARQLRTGAVFVNGASTNFAVPIGGFKQSGNGREWGVYGFEEFLELQSIVG